MADKVIFRKGLAEAYQALESKDGNTIYWLTDTQELYVGDKLFGIGKEATSKVAGLMSPKDKENLDNLVSHGVAVSGKEDNIIEVAQDGLYAALTIEETDDGQYQLYSLNYNGDKKAIGSAIDIPKAFKTGSVKTVEEVNEPYTGAQVGDKYLDIVFDDVSQEENTEKHFYIPVTELVDQIEAGNGIEVDGTTVSVKIDADESNGLESTPDGLKLGLATTTLSGAMSSVDKKFLNSIPTVYNIVKYEMVKDAKISGTRFMVRDDEIRVMFAKDSAWHDQNGGGEPNVYYMGIRFFAPNDDVIGFKRGQGKEVEGDFVKCTIGGDTGGIDQYNRKYYIGWYPVARKDGDAWTYLGAGSEEGRYLGWYTTIEWYEKDPTEDESAKSISSETIRINLSNENCHNSTLPYYSSQMSISWEEMTKD